MGPLSVLPPKPNLSQKGGAQWASQWQFFLLLHTFGAEGGKNIQREQGQDTQDQGTLPDPLSNTCRLSKREAERQHRTSGEENGTACLCSGAAVDSRLPFPGLPRKAVELPFSVVRGTHLGTQNQETMHKSVFSGRLREDPAVWGGEVGLQLDLLFLMPMEVCRGLATFLGVHCCSQMPVLSLSPLWPLPGSLSQYMIGNDSGSVPCEEDGREGKGALPLSVLDNAL